MNHMDFNSLSVPALGRQRQKDFLQLEASLVYTETFQASLGLHSKTILQKLLLSSNDYNNLYVTYVADISVICLLIMNFVFAI